MYAASHATQHWLTTTQTVFTVLLSSCFIVEIAATQGVYKSAKVRKLSAERMVNKPVIAPVRASVPTFIRTPRVLTTASFAMRPVTRLVTTRQSANPRGANTGAIHIPMMPRRLVVLSEETTFSYASKCWRNQITIVATKIIVNARRMKSHAFSHIRSSTLLSEGIR